LYDIAVIGAGINGSCITYELTSAGKEVILFDGGGIASGGSGAAGAFISPKFSKSGDLKDILHSAFCYSLDFYEKNFSDLFTKCPLLHIAKDEVDDVTLRIYKEKTDLELLDAPWQERETVSINAGIVNAKSMCEALSKSANFKEEEIVSLEYADGVWIINESYSAKEVVLATGAYKTLLNEPYIKLRGVWGHRIDVKTSTDNAHSIHQFVSISPSKRGLLSIGATHNVHYHPETAEEEYDIQEGRMELLEKASHSIHLENIEIIEDYMGLRSGSFDYMPMVGPLVISRETLQSDTIHFQTKKPDFTSYTYYPNLTMINGSGGYGFVLAPYLAKILVEYILSGKEVGKKVHPARFFARWAKKRSEG